MFWDPDTLGWRMAAVVVGMAGVAGVAVRAGSVAARAAGATGAALAAVRATVLLYRTQHTWWGNL